MLHVRLSAQACTSSVHANKTFFEIAQVHVTQIPSVHHTFGQVLEDLFVPVVSGFLIGTFLTEAKYCWSVRRPGLTTMHDSNLYRYITMISSAT